MNLVTIEEAAKQLGCTTANIYRVIDEKGIHTPLIEVERETKITRTFKLKHVDLEVLKRNMKKHAPKEDQ